MILLGARGINCLSFDTKSFLLTSSILMQLGKEVDGCTLLRAQLLQKWSCELFGSPKLTVRRVKNAMKARLGLKWMDHKLVHDQTEC